MPETTPDHPPMAEMPSAPRQRLRYLRILDAAAGPARKGLDAVDLPEVAERSDVPLGTVCRYFPTPTHLMLALYRHQLGELRAAAPKPSARRGGRMLTGAVMEVFHLRVMQPAVEQCLVRGVYLPELDTTALLQDTDSLAGKLIIDAGGDATTARLLLPAITGLVQSVRNRRLSLFEAEEDLKKACARLAPAVETGLTLPRTA